MVNQNTFEAETDGGLPLPASHNLFALLADLREREATARRAELRYRATLDQPDVGVAHVAPDLRFLSVSDGLCAFLGYSREDLLGLDFASVSHPDDVEPELSQARRLAAGELDGYALEKRYLRNDGTVAWGYATGALLRDVTGAALYSVVVVVDVMERKEAEAGWAVARAELERLRGQVDAALRVSPTGVTVVEAPSGRLVYRNDEAARLLRAPPHAPVWSAELPPGFEALHPDGRHFMPHEYPLTRALGGELVYGEEVLYPRDDGTFVHLSVSAAPVRDAEGRVILAVSSFEDLSVRRRLEEELRQAEARAKSASSAKSAFLALMSHELRTPLTSILGFCDLLLMGAPESVGFQAAEQVKRIRASAHDLLTLMDEVLDFARLEAGDRLELRIEPVPVGEVLSAVVEGLGPSARARGLPLEATPPDPGLTVRTDRYRLEQVLANLTANAIKFTETGEITLGARREDGSVIVTVQDSGIGVAPDRVEGIFDPFWQLETARGHLGRVGVGLAMARRLTRLLGGELRVESELGLGSIFSIVLPDEPGLDDGS